MSTAIEKLRHSTRMSRMNAQREVQRYKHSVFSAGTAGLLGFAETKGKTLPVIIPGVEGEISFGVAALFLASYAKGDTGRVLQSLADALLSIGMYKVGKRAGSVEIKSGGVGDASAMDALLTAAAANMAAAG